MKLIASSRFSSAILLTLALAASLVFFIGGKMPARAQIGEKTEKVAPDRRIKTMLDKQKLKYTVTDSGTFKLTFDLDNGRTQLVCINSETETLDNLEIREVWSPAYRTDGALAAAVATKLLRENGKVKLGAWEIAEGDNQTTAIFTAKISAVASWTSLDSTMKAVFGTADRMEKEITGKDEF